MNHGLRLVAPAPGGYGDMADVYGLQTMVGWRINGHPARLLIWSPEEWERLDVRPIDAQFHPFGVWCALRLLE
mgnify:CR=1 FL=1